MDTAIVQRFLDGMKYESERTAPPEGFPSLPDIPAGRYTDPAFLELEMTHLWRKSWLYACHIDELPEQGSYLLWKKTGSPILIVRGKDDVVRAFYNTCRHRGGPLVKSACGKVDGLVCGYHGWTYSLDGKLINLRDRRDFPGLDLASRPLIGVRCERFYNWIFINEDPGAEPLLEHVNPFFEYFQQFEPDCWRLVAQEGFERPLQRQGAARCLSRGVSPEVDTPEHRRSLPRSPRHHHRALSQGSFHHGHAEPAS